MPKGGNMTTRLTTSDRYFGARRLAAMDQLGSAGSGTSSGPAYFPWGEPRSGTGPQDTWNFATYTRDSASGLDYAMNRYYSNAYGRFMTSDPYPSSMDVHDPGSLNRYAYTSNDPANLNDPTGLDATCSMVNGQFVCVDNVPAPLESDGGGSGYGSDGGGSGYGPEIHPYMVPFRIEIRWRRSPRHIQGTNCCQRHYQPAKAFQERI